MLRRLTRKLSAALRRAGIALEAAANHLHPAMVGPALRAIARRLGLRSRSPRPERERTAADRALTERLYTTFERDLELVNIHGVQFYVQDGTVTIYGTVHHELDQELLEALVRQIPGVTAVVGHLQVVDSRFQEPDADA